MSFRAVIGPAPQVTPQVLAIVAAAERPCTRNDLRMAAGLKDREYFRTANLDPEPLLAARWFDMTIPDKPRSSKQRYRTIDAGRRILESQEPD
ncbi:MAG TPA: hypothetical protein PKA76_01095 [Pirellulaceae bacterium]|nr:hypothetical protein [Pirellulaceae bacterium]